MWLGTIPFHNMLRIYIHGSGSRNPAPNAYKRSARGRTDWIYGARLDAGADHAYIAGVGSCTFS